MVCKVDQWPALHAASSAAIPGSRAQTQLHRRDAHTNTTLTAKKYITRLKKKNISETKTVVAWLK
jgi:hypothetical protein